MKHKVLLFCCALSIAGFSSCDKDDDNNDDLNQTDREFLINAAYSNLAEIDAGTLASTKAMNAEVKNFGSHMISEHSLAMRELDSLATMWNVNTPDTVDAEHKALKQYLSSLSGTSFDTAYMNSQIKDHQKTIALFENEKANGDEDAIQNYYVDKFLPHIREHLTSAQAIRAKLPQ